jgi:hypothetical protein
MNERFRVCAVCGKRHGATYGFHTTLTRLGIPGDKAVPACVIKAVARAERAALKAGRKIERKKL